MNIFRVLCSKRWPGIRAANKSFRKSRCRQGFQSYYSKRVSNYHYFCSCYCDRINMKENFLFFISSGRLADGWLSLAHHHHKNEVFIIFIVIHQKQWNHNVWSHLRIRCLKIKLFYNPSSEELLFVAYKL